VELVYLARHGDFVYEVDPVRRAKRVI